MVLHAHKKHFVQTFLLNSFAQVYREPAKWDSAVVFPTYSYNLPTAIVAWKTMIRDIEFYEFTVYQTINESRIML